MRKPTYDKLICTWVATAAIAITSDSCNAQSVSQPIISFTQAVQHYQSGDWPTAAAEFSELANAGIASALFNLGLMTVNGQGVPADKGIAIGLLKAAKELGANVPDAYLRTLDTSANNSEKQTTQLIATQHGKSAIIDRLTTALKQCKPDWNLSDAYFPTADSSESTDPSHTGATRISKTHSVFYPSKAERRDQQGIVVASALIDEQGKAKDPQVEAIIPLQNNEGFLEAATEYFQSGQYQPATENGLATAARVRLRVIFRIDEKKPLWQSKELEALKAGALSGKPAYQYMAAYMISLYPAINETLGFSNDDQIKFLLNAGLVGVPEAQLDMSTIFGNMPCDQFKPLSYFWLEQAANSNVPRAQLYLAKFLLLSAYTPEQSERIRSLLLKALSSKDAYARKHAAYWLATAPASAVRNPAAALQAAQELKEQITSSQAVPDIDEELDIKQRLQKIADKHDTIKIKYRESTDPEYDIVLAAAQAALGNFSSATTAQQAALEKAKVLGWDTRQLEEMLLAYQQQQTPDLSDFYMSWPTEKLNRH